MSATNFGELEGRDSAIDGFPSGMSLVELITWAQHLELRH